MSITGKGPSWLKIAENGSKGEARTKALLLDRFWVLERSVDVDGADFIVQPRDGKHLLSKNPPRMALVQAKFFQNAKTNAYIHAEYVKDENDVPRAEFFILVHSQEEDEQTVYLLSAHQVVNEFTRVPPGQEYAGRYKVDGKTVLSEKFKSTRKNILNVIKNALDLASVQANRQFIGQFLHELTAQWLQEPPLLKLTSIDADEYFRREPAVHTQVNEWKQIARDNLRMVNWMKSSLEVILETGDPIEALCELDSFQFERGALKSFWQRGWNEQSEHLFAEILQEYCNIYFREYLAAHAQTAIWEESKRVIEERVQDWCAAQGATLSAQHQTVRLYFDASLAFQKLEIEAGEMQPGYTQRHSFSAHVYTRLYAAAEVCGRQFAAKLVWQLEQDLARSIATAAKSYNLPTSI
ncbi:hypothetical protein MJ904_00070 [Massilia sp. MB5]|uniref:hypothetical protein n=1 Tax=Massilia sp. MB5 TaxID=2919578 RepID=UPI001F0FCC82|nr:hypothetical protein [Massilia sp. MB5]UMR30717.1 hypothetical protein MJ904_00070 [Massilia sp. MB5]